MTTREQQIDGYMADMEANLLRLYEAVVDADAESPQLRIFRNAIDRYASDRNRMNLSDDAAVRRWFEGTTLLGEQMEAEAAFRSVSWQTGFFEALGRRYVELLDGLPTPKEALGAGVSVAASAASGTIALAVLAVALGVIYVYSQERGRA